MGARPKPGKRHPDAITDRELAVEIDGPGVAPRTVNPLALLQLAEAWFRLTLKTAENLRLGLTLLGLAVKDKCAAVVVKTSDPHTAKAVLGRAWRLVAGEDMVPSGSGEAVEDVRRNLRALPPNQRAKARLGSTWVQALRAPEAPELELPWETTELRVTPTRVGGRNEEGTATLVSDSEDAPFTVAVSIEDARVLGAALGKTIDVEIELCRTPTGRIERGRVRSVYALDESAEPTAAWRAWAASAAGDWSEIDDVAGALGRGLD